MKRCLIVLICNFALLLSFSNYSLSEESRPFWTEKSSYEEGEFIYFIGVATASPNSETGRKTALKNALNEITNYLQITDISGLTTETQMTYEALDKNGTLSVYRLMRVKIADLQALKMSNLKKSKEAAAEALLVINKELEEKKIILGQAIKGELELAATNSEIQRVRASINLSSKRASSIPKCGMSESEIETLMGAARSKANCAGTTYLNYGRTWLVFESGILACSFETSQFMACILCMSGGKACQP